MVVRNALLVVHLILLIGPHVRVQSFRQQSYPLDRSFIFNKLRASTQDSPPLREFLPLPPLFTENPPAVTAGPVVRVQQFNVLADGLAGLRPDQGKFSRLDKSVLDWEARKTLLLNEIVQYDADIITLQEVDHYHDFFQPQLEALGYVGYFAPKPTSACLDVSDSNDGCALFVRRSRLRVVSCESKTLALSIAKLNEGGELEEEAVGSNIQAQNQVALIAVLEFVNNNTTNSSSKIGAMAVDGNDDYRWYFPDGGLSGNIVSAGGSRAVRFSLDSPPPLLVSTVHLKSAKTAVGELYRQKGILQVLEDLTRIYKAFGRIGKPPAVILTGDFNSEPEIAQSLSSSWSLPFQSGGDAYRDGYAPLTYRATKLHSLGLRSVYNDDLPRSPVPSRSRELYSTWKARNLLGVRDGQIVRLRESVIKRCIDYIFYVPFRRGPYRSFTEPEGQVVAKSSDQVVLSLLLRSTVYLFGAVIPSSALLSSRLSGGERLQVIILAALGLLIFEIFSEGSIFRPEISEVDVIEGIDYEARNPLNSAGSPLNSAGKAIVSGTDSGKALMKRVKTISKQLQSSSQYGNPGVQPVKVLDLLSEEQVGPTLLPNSKYPSDHVSIVADLQILW